MKNQPVKLIFSPYHDGCKKCFDSSTFEKEEKRYVVERFAESLSMQGVKSFADAILDAFGERLLIIGPGPHCEFDGTLRCYDPLHLSWFKKALNI